MNTFWDWLESQMNQVEEWLSPFDNQPLSDQEIVDRLRNRWNSFVAEK